MSRRAEIAVIGTGPGGAMAACVLAEAGRDVLLLEAGPSVPQNSAPPFSLEEFRSKYADGGVSAALGRGSIPFVEGKVVGGSSEINSALYHRTPDAVLAKWTRETRARALEPENLRPHFEAIEADLTVGLDPAGASPASRRFEGGFRRLGLPCSDTPRMFAYGQGTGEGRRQSMSKTFVPRARAAGATVLPSSRAARLVRAGARWRVEIAGADAVEADFVFAAGGALRTPALLRRSGLAPRAGATLRLHPMIKAAAVFDEAVNAPGMGVPTHQAREADDSISYGCSVATPAHLAVHMTDHPEDAAVVARDWRRMGTYYATVSGRASGTVAPFPFTGDPLARYELDPADRVDLARGLRRLCEALFAAGATAVFPGVAGVGRLGSVAELSRLPSVLDPRSARVSTVHLFGSCPMGERPDSPADSFGAVRGASGLYVSDASMLCGALGVNPQGTILALARRNAQHFLRGSGE